MNPDDTSGPMFYISDQLVNFLREANLGHGYPNLIEGQPNTIELGRAGTRDTGVCRTADFVAQRGRGNSDPAPTLTCPIQSIP